jgi:large subunit ribosomal protein L22
MDLTTTARFVRMSPRKARDIIGQLGGLPVAEAIRRVRFSPTKAAALISKTLKSAVADAENNAKMSAGGLRVKTAVVEEGPRLRRYWPRARGGASPIRKRMCHIRIVLTDEAVRARRGRRA